MLSLVLFIVVAAALMIVVALCAAGVIKRNSWLGIRIPATRLSEDAWKVGHRAALVPVLIGGLVTMVAAGVGLAAPNGTSWALPVVSGALIGSLLVSALRAHKAASSYGSRRF